MNTFESAKTTIDACLGDKNFLKRMKDSSDLIIATIEKGKKILVSGNGGSAAEAQHFVAELVGRYKVERVPYPAIALTTDTSILTAVSNDYQYDCVFSRQVNALGDNGDLLIILSTSGNSKNCITALEVAQARKMKTISLLGKNGGAARRLADVDLIVPSTDTARIQEVHLMIIHDWCEKIDEIKI